MEAQTSALKARFTADEVQKLDESRFQRLLMGQSNSWGDASRLKLNCAPGAKQIQRGALRVQGKNRFSGLFVLPAKPLNGLGTPAKPATASG